MPNISADTVEKVPPQEWVAGFLFTDNFKKVALIKKSHPEWQRGKWNGVGGKVEGGESPREAMLREWKEESGLLPGQNWKEFCILDWKGGRVHFFVAYSEWECDGFKQDEEWVHWHEVEDSLYERTIPNLRWLIPLALDKDAVVAQVQEPDAWNLRALEADSGPSEADRLAEAAQEAYEKGIFCVCEDNEEMRCHGCSGIKRRRALFEALAAYTKSKEASRANG